MLAAAALIGLVQYGPLTTEWTVAHLAYRVLPQAAGAWAALSLVLCGGLQLARARRS